MILTPLQKPTAIISVFIQAVLLWKLSAIKWLSRRRVEEMKVPSNSPQTTMLPLRHWSLVQRSKDGKEADAGNTNYTYIQEFFCSYLTKVDSLEHHVISYNFKDILMLRELCDVKQVDPWVKWGPPKIYLLKDFAKISLHIIPDHQVDTNMFCSKHDQQSSGWLYALVFNSITIKLCDCVIPTYNEIPSSH